MTNAATISRKLAEGGHRPLGSGASRMRQGLRVRRSLSAIAFVSADYDGEGEAARAIVERERKAALGYDFGFQWPGSISHVADHPEHGECWVVVVP